MKTVNLYIPSCHLQTHYVNMLDDNVAYDFDEPVTNEQRALVIKAVNSVVKV